MLPASQRYLHSACHWTAFCSFDLCDAVFAFQRNLRMLCHVIVLSILLFPSDRTTDSLCCVSSTVLLISCQCLKTWRPASSTRQLKCLLRWASTWDAYMNIFRCVLCMHESVSSTVPRLTLPQRRTSLCTQPWRQSWLPFFMSCVTELWKRVQTPDRLSTGWL